MASTTYRIGEVARRVGVTPRAIRFYQEKGLLSPCGQTEGGLRLFSESDLRRLALIRGLQSLGMSLERIKAILEDGAGDQSKDARLAHTLGVLRLERDQVEAEMARLSARREEIDRIFVTLGRCPQCPAQVCPPHCPPSRVML